MRMIYLSLKGLRMTELTKNLSSSTNGLLFVVKKYFANYAGLPAGCWQGIGLNAIESTLGGICFFLSLYFINDLHLSVITAGFLISIYGLGRMCGGLIGGSLADKISPLLVSISSLLVQAICFFILKDLHTINLLIIDLFLVGLTAYAFIAANNFWILNQCNNQEETRLKVLSMIYSGSNLGIGLSALFVSILSRFGFAFIFTFVSILLFVSAIYAFFCTQKEKIPLTSSMSFLKPDITKNDQSQIKSNVYLIFFVLGCLFFVGLIIAQIGSMYPVHMHDAFPALGMDAISFPLALNSTLIIIFQTPLVNYFNQHNKISMIGVGAFLIGLGMFMLDFSSLFLIALFACIIYTVGEMLFFSIAQMISYQKSPQNKKGFFLGLFRTVYAMSLFAGPALGGVVYHQFGSTILWLCCGVVGFIVLVGCTYLKRFV